MKKRLTLLTATFFIYVAVMVVLKAAFMLLEPAFSDISAGEFFAAIGHGFSMDCTVAGYFTAIPLLLLIASVWYPAVWLRKTTISYFAVIAALIAIIYVADAALFPYWEFRLDMTPIFYFTTSPSAAMASVEWWMWILGIIGLAAVFMLAWLPLRFLWAKKSRLNVFNDSSRSDASEIKESETEFSAAKKCIMTIVLILCGVVLVVIKRGGFTVATMNPSRVYFSTDMRLNQAATNPAFSLIYSLSHQGNFGNQFRYLDDEDAYKIVERLFSQEVVVTDSCSDLPHSGFLYKKRPDIYIIILESFSAHLLPSMGGEPIAMSLDSIAREGITFRNAYASSFRTDRSITAILSGYPAPPTTSLLKYVEKLRDIESLQGEFVEEGYDAEYYYGGDISFTNVNAYLRASGIEKVISDKDFPMGERLSKWGVHDGPLFNRVKKEIESSNSEKPVLRIIQTSSSHEPFEVPFNAAENPRINAFMYTDSVFGDFVGWLKASNRWDNSLLLVTPDHYGCYPLGQEGAVDRHHIPIVLTGGAILDLKDSVDYLLDMPMAQTDIPATMLSLFGLAHCRFKFSNDALDPDRIPFAFVTEPSFAAFITPDGPTSISTASGELVEGSDSLAAISAKAILQRLYDDLDAR